MYYINGLSEIDLRIRGRFQNYLCVAPNEETKNTFYEQLDKAYTKLAAHEEHFDCKETNKKIDEIITYIQ